MKKLIVFLILVFSSVSFAGQNKYIVTVKTIKNYPSAPAWKYTVEEKTVFAYNFFIDQGGTLIFTNTGCSNRKFIIAFAPDNWMSFRKEEQNEKIKGR